MSEPPSGSEPRRSLLERLSALLLRAPEDREQLLSLLRAAHVRDLLDADALSMIEGVLQVSELAARDIMVPRAQMDVIDVGQLPAEFLPRVIATAHSRFPVVEGERDNVIGILHAKDLLRLFAEDPPEVRDLLRPAVFIPESKRLNVLLRDFRANHNHVAIVVDEYGGVAGLVTIEDALEEIVGELVDEHDRSVVPVEDLGAGLYRVPARLSKDDLGELFGFDVEDDDVDTAGGLLAKAIGKVPLPGATGDIHGLHLVAERADGRRRQVSTLLVRISDPHDPDTSQELSALERPDDEHHGAHR